MTKGHRADRNERRPFIEEPEDTYAQPFVRGRPTVYRKHTKDEGTQFIHNSAGEYSRPCEQPAPPQYMPRLATDPGYLAPVPSQPILPSDAPYLGRDSQLLYPATYFRGQHLPAQLAAVQSSDGFHCAEFPYRGYQGTYASVHRPLVPQPFQQPHTARTFQRTERWHDSRSGQDGFATQHSGYRCGNFKHEPDPEFNHSTEPRHQRHGSRTLAYEHSSDDEPPPSYDDARAGDNRQQQQKPRNTVDLAITRPKARQATSEDATKHRIPPGYDLEEWDPDEKPITLLGSIFDACSLGKWIVDWTVFAHGSYAAETRTARQLCESLLRVTNKIRISANFISQNVGIERVDQGQNVEMVEDFVESGERLMKRFQELVKGCEEAMHDADTKDTGELNESDGLAFVYAIFSSEEQSAKTYSLMKGMRLWNQRWDENCGFIIGIESDTEQPMNDVANDDGDSEY